MMNPKESGARTKVRPDNMISVAMEDLPEAERRELEKELEEEMAEARRRKLMCFQKTCTRVIKKTVPAITTTATTTSTVTPNHTLKELVKFTRAITEEVRSTLDTFKIDLQNMLPQ
jgi:translation initiation factor IF-2